MDARYRLSAMRQTRSRDEQATRWQLAAAVGDAQALAAGVAAVADQVARCRAAIGEARGQRDQLLAGGASGARLAQLERYLGRLRGDLAAAIGAAARAEARHAGQLDAVDAAQARLRLARADREVIERHFAAWRADQRKRAERRED